MGKRYAVVVAALIIGLNDYPLQTMADELKDTETVEETEAENAESMEVGETVEGTEAAGTGTKDTETVEETETADEIEPVKGTETGDAEKKKTIEGTEAAKETGNAEYMDTVDTEGNRPLFEKMLGSESAGRLSLQMPQKLEVVIDPFEIDGRGQIYSEQYRIWNTGETTGILTLSFLCISGEDGGQEIYWEKDGIHDGEGKSVRLEAVFGDSDRLALSKERSEYQAELAPGEGLVMYFTGEVNENASDQWRDDDINIEGIYSWEHVVGDVPEESMDAEADIPTDEKTDVRTDTGAVDSELEGMPDKGPDEEAQLGKTDAPTDVEAEEAEEIGASDEPPADGGYPGESVDAEMDDPVGAGTEEAQEMETSDVLQTESDSGALQSPEA